MNNPEEIILLENQKKEYRELLLKSITGYEIDENIIDFVFENFFEFKILNQEKDQALVNKIKTSKKISSIKFVNIKMNFKEFIAFLIQSYFFTQDVEFSERNELILRILMLLLTLNSSITLDITGNEAYFLDYFYFQNDYDSNKFYELDHIFLEFKNFVKYRYDIEMSKKKFNNIITFLTSHDCIEVIENKIRMVESVRVSDNLYL